MAVKVAVLKKVQSPKILILTNIIISSINYSEKPCPNAPGYVKSTEGGNK